MLVHRSLQGVGTTGDVILHAVDSTWKRMSVGSGEVREGKGEGGGGGSLRWREPPGWHPVGERVAKRGGRGGIHGDETGEREYNTVVGIRRCIDG